MHEPIRSLQACSVGKAREAPRDLVSKRAPNLFTMPYYFLAQQERALLGPNQVPGEVQGPRETGMTEPTSGSDKGPSPPSNLHRTGRI